MSDARLQLQRALHYVLISALALAVDSIHDRSQLASSLLLSCFAETAVENTNATPAPRLAPVEECKAADVESFTIQKCAAKTRKHNFTSAKYNNHISTVVSRYSHVMSN